MALPSRTDRMYEGGITYADLVDWMIRNNGGCQCEVRLQELEKQIAALKAPKPGGNTDHTGIPGFLI